MKSKQTPSVAEQERNLRALEMEAPLGRSSGRRGRDAGSTAKGPFSVTLYGVGGERITSYTVATYAEAKKLELDLSEDHEGDGMFAKIDE